MDHQRSKFNHISASVVDLLQCHLHLGIFRKVNLRRFIWPFKAKEQWRMFRERQGRLRSPNSFNFMQFLGKFGKIVRWRPPGELAPLPRGNPGSATGMIGESN